MVATTLCGVALANPNVLRSCRMTEACRQQCKWQDRSGKQGQQQVRMAQPLPQFLVSSRIL